MSYLQSGGKAQCDMQNTYPKPKKTTDFRVVGPRMISGMKCWFIYNAKTGEQIGPACFSLDQVRGRIDDLLVGRERVWFGNTPFKKKPIT